MAADPLHQSTRSARVPQIEPRLDALEILAEIQRANRCVRTVCVDMAGGNCICGQQWRDDPRVKGALANV